MSFDQKHRYVIEVHDTQRGRSLTISMPDLMLALKKQLSGRTRWEEDIVQVFKEDEQASK